MRRGTEQAQRALAQLERSTVRVEVVARSLLRTAGGRDLEVHPLADAEPGGARRSRVSAPRLPPEPVAVQMPRVHLVRAADRRPHHDRITDVRLEDGVAGSPWADEKNTRRVSPPAVERLGAEADLAPGRSTTLLSLLPSWRKQTSSRKLPRTSADTGSVSGHMDVGDVPRSRSPLRSTGSWYVLPGGSTTSAPTSPLLPRLHTVHVVVEVRRADLRIGVPAVAHELGADDRSPPGCGSRAVGRGDAVPVDRHDAADLEPCVISRFDTDQRTPRRKRGCVDRPRSDTARGRDWLSDVPPDSANGRTVCS